MSGPCLTERQRRGGPPLRQTLARKRRWPSPRLPRRRAVALKTALLLALAAGAALLALTGGAGTAAAHPLGNFTVNRYARVEPGADRVRVVYVVDMAEIPTFQEMSALDRDGDRQVSAAERRAYLDRRLPELARGLLLIVGGQPLRLEVESGAVALTEGEGGLPILRIDAVFTAPLPAQARSGLLDARLRDTNYDNRAGWKEIVVRGTGGAAVRASSVPAADLSDALRAYPDGALTDPLEVREAWFRFEPGVADPAAGTAPADAARAARHARRAAPAGVLSRFAESAATRELTLPLALFLLLAAVFWGALHALGPGHGKTVVAAYLVGARGTARHAVFLGLTVTATHTAGVYFLGLLTLSASHVIVPERLYPALSLVSGLLVVAMGLGLLIGRLRALGLRRFGGRAAAGQPIAPEQELALAGAGASPTGRAPGRGRHHAVFPGNGGGAHRHGMFGHRHHHGPGGHGHHAHDHAHHHGHSHTFPGRDGGRVTWRSLLALGIYGGLIPCPTAIVVLLTSISLDRVGFGLLLVVAFSAGLAAVLTGIGLALVYAGRALERVRVHGALVRAVPVLSAAAVVVVGVLITLRAAGAGGLPVV
jgi:nickel/cobalt exporter